MNNSALDDVLITLKSQLEDGRIWFKENHALKYETYFKMGGVARIFICPQTTDDFVRALIIVRSLSLAYKVIGLTSNVLFFDEISYSVVISTKNLQSVVVTGDNAYVDCGYSLQDFVRVAVVNGASGFEGLEGIPGTVGGGIFMNAGAYGYTISDNLVSVRCLTEDNQVVEKSFEECKFTHRTSIFRGSTLIILGATFRFVPGDREKIARLIETFHIARHSYQEFVYPNLGSLYSVSGRVYSELFRGSRPYAALHMGIKLLLKNPVSKFVNRKRPTNAPFNRLFQKYNGRLAVAPSHKSINILINDGAHSSEDIYQYVKSLRGRLRPEIRIENEFVVDPAYSVDKSFTDLRERFRIGF